MLLLKFRLDILKVCSLFYYLLPFRSCGLDYHQKTELLYIIESSKSTLSMKTCCFITYN